MFETIQKILKYEYRYIYKISGDERPAFKLMELLALLGLYNLALDLIYKSSVTKRWIDVLFIPFYLPLNLLKLVTEFLPSCLYSSTEQFLPKYLATPLLFILYPLRTIGRS